MKLVLNQAFLYYYNAYCIVCNDIVRNINFIGPSQSLHNKFVYLLLIVIK